MKNTTTIANKINKIKKINGENYDRKLCISYNKSIFVSDTSLTEDIGVIRYQDDSVLEFNTKNQTTRVRGDL